MNTEGKGFGVCVNYSEWCSSCIPTPRGHDGEVELTFLGTSGGVPTPERNVSALARRDHADGTWELFDCGDGTQQQLLRTSLSPARLRRVFISHLHGDHFYGLWGLLSSRAMIGDAGGVDIVGHRGLRHLVDTVFDAGRSRGRLDIRVIEIDDAGGSVPDPSPRSVIAIPLAHRIPSFAWSMLEPERPGRVDTTVAARLGVPAGPLLGALQRGEAVRLESGRTIRPADILGPPRRGRHIVIAGDNSDPDALLHNARRHHGDIDLLVHEATFTDEIVARLGDDRGHSTAERVAAAARQHSVPHLILTHFSPRFSGEAIEHLRTAARSSFAADVHLANDFDRFTFDRNLRLSVSHAGRPAPGR